MRITKELVTKIARQLCQPKSDAIDLKIKEFNEEVYKYALKRIPKQLIELYENKTIRPYIKTTTSLFLNDCDKNGLRSLCYSGLPKELPVTTRQFSNVNFIFDELDVSYFMGKVRDIESLIKEKNDLKAEIEVVLASLRTYKQITDKFPEAAPYLPQSGDVSVALSIPIDSVRNKLKSK